MNVMVKKEWIEKGYVDEPVDEALDLKAEIRKLCKEKDAIIIAHYYTVGEIQDIADFVGDSLALARKAAETDAQVMVMCGVHFMAETCKLLSPDKTVICPDLNAGCSLADSCKAEDLKKYKEEHPGYKVVSYVNTTAAVKALTDCVVTSGNAKKVIDSFPQNEKIIFGPDYNLGNYINSVTGRNMLLWNGGCHVHEKFSVEAIVKLKQKHPEAVVMAHLECKVMNDQKPFFGVSSSFFFSAGRTSACWIWDTIAGILLFTISPVLRRRPNVSMTVSNNSSFLSSSRHNESMRDCCSGDFTYLFSVCNMLQTLSFFVW